jgi:hypothetical protein
MPHYKDLMLSLLKHEVRGRVSRCSEPEWQSMHASPGGNDGDPDQ